jgi:hypothetical protein
MSHIGESIPNAGSIRMSDSRKEHRHLISLRLSWLTTRGTDGVSTSPP